MKQVLLAGCGKMGSAMLEGWISRLDDPMHFTVVDPALAGDDHPLKKSFGQAGNVTLLAQLDDSTPAPDLVVLAVKPQMMAEALPPLTRLARPDTVWLSIAAGISMPWLQAAIAPDAAVIRTMPNTPSAIGRGVTAIIASAAVPADMDALAERMLGVIGRVVRLKDEADMDAVTAVSGSGPAYVFLMREALEQAALKAGLAPELASVLAADTMAGSVALMQESDQSPGQLRVNVTSPGGTTQAALDVLMAEDGLMALLEDAVMAARNRSKALGN